ncbi:MAG TPA: hypothetical protein VL899_05340 [Alphaproteobacteria bacterium]|jgi:hypothetical protein|nr:hypothetical protein [Alphaproteobacteria bacterium]
MPRLRLAGFTAAAVVLLSAGASAGPPFVTDDPEPVDPHVWEVNYALTGTLVSGGGDSSLPLIDANYGAAAGLQLHIQPQLAVTRAGGRTHAGIGDTEIGVKYRLIGQDDDGWMPLVSVYPLVELPTGSKRRGLGEGTARTFLPIWAEKTIGRWTVYGGGGYGINPGGGKNAWFAGGVALYQLTPAFQLGGELFLQTAELQGDPDAPGFNIGGIYAVTDEFRLLFSAGSGLAHRDQTNQLSGYLALQIQY